MSDIIGVSRAELDRAVEKHLLQLEFLPEVTSEVIKEAAARWLQEWLDDILEDLDWWAVGPYGPRTFTFRRRLDDVLDEHEKKKEVSNALAN